MALFKYLDPKNDIAFKKIFGTEKNKDILLHFLNDILNFSGDNHIIDIEFLSPILSPKIAVKKQSIVDVLCKDKKGVKYIIEMQVTKSRGFEKRAQYYASQVYGNQVNIGDEYH
ncbi:MAG TPA: Rpn family recombination-promoting nuclease/putative transposase, partial [Candidatus Rhabdochlamydia sp.]|nr:Rpn family recombination-promoting nuclease/putative transposase [Candidatus Rhabdochlamydia sp.]